MKGEIIIQQYLPNNLQIICTISRAIKKKNLKIRDQQNKRCCSYREFAKVIVELKKPCQYKSIVSTKSNTNNDGLIPISQQNMESNHNLSLKESQSQYQTTQGEETEIQINREKQQMHGKQKKKQQKLKILHDPVSLNLLNEYRNLCSHNIMKNIKEGFLRYIGASNNNQKIEYLEKLINNQATYQQIKRKVKSLRNFQDNKAIKIICRHPITQIIFKDFLERADQEWLTNSKIKEKDKCLKMAQFLIKIIGQIEYLDVIENYTKK